MIFIPIFFGGAGGGPLVVAGRYEKLRKFLAMSLLALAAISAIVVFVVGYMDSVYLSSVVQPKYFLGSLLPQHDVFALLGVVAAVLVVPVLAFIAVSRRDNFVVTALGAVMVAVLTAMVVTAFLPLGR
jgi:hypothetical protein